MKKAKKTISTISIYIGLIALFGGMMYSCEKSNERRERYEIEHNCKYDYNDLCYTREQRPWLFK